MKSPDYYRQKEQTYLKHFFLERYLETVAFHIGYSHLEFVHRRLNAAITERKSLQF